jgi:hypothetical protein
MTSDHWAIRTRRRRLTTLAIVLTVCLLDAAISWTGGDTFNGAFGTSGVVLCTVLLIATLRERPPG